MKKIILALALIICASGAKAQIRGAVQTTTGQAVAGAIVTVCSYSSGSYNSSGQYTGSFPCSPASTIYYDPALTQAITTLLSDGQGNYFFYAAAGNYTVTITAPGRIQSYGFSATINSSGSGCIPGGSAGALQKNSNPTGSCNAAALVDNGTTITASEPVVTPTLNNVITPLQYGAKCDGSTDDSTSLQNTINAAQTISSATGAVIYIPPGKMCVFGTTLNIAGGTLGGIAPGLRIVGAGPKQTQLVGGSGLEYTGTGNGFVIEGSLGTSDFSYFVSMQNLYLKATAAATSIIRAYNLNGPADFTGDIFDASNTAVNAVTCSSNCGIQINVHDDLFFGFTGNQIDFRGAGPFSIKDNQFFSSPVGIYLSGMAVATVADNYFELDTDAIEIGNDTAEAWGSYDIHGNTINSGSSHSAPQRCLLISSTNNSFPFYAQGSFKNNFCNLSNGFAQGLATYNVEFNTSANAFAVSQTWEVENNTFLGAVTSAIHNDNTNVNTVLKDNTSLQYYSVSSPAPALALTSGSGLFNPVCLSTSCVLKQNASPVNPASGSNLLNFDTSDIFGPLTSAGAFAGGKFGSLNDTGLGGSTQCVESVAGVITGTGALCPPTPSISFRQYTASQTLTGADAGVVDMKCASACTVTLPASIPANYTAYSIEWDASGAGTVTIDPNGKNMTICTNAASTSTFAMPAVGGTVYIATDGTSWFASCPAKAGTNVTIAPSSTGQIFSSSGGGAFSGGSGSSFQDASEIAAPANPSAGVDRLWLDSTSHLLSCHTSAGASCMPSGGSGTVTGVTLQGTANQITVSGTCNITTSGTCTFSLPNTVLLGTDASANGQIQLSNGGALGTHTIIGSAATTSNTFLFPVAVPTNLHSVYCAVSTTVCTLTDTGYAYNAIPNADLQNSATTVNGTPCTLGSTCSPTANTPNAATFNNGGAGAASGTTFDGSVARTISYNTLGAAPLASPTFTGTVTIPSGSALNTPTSINLSNATSLPCAAMPALTGNVTTPAGACSTTIASGAVSTADLANNAVTSAKMAVANTYRVCDIAIGDTSASALTNAQLGPQSRVCFVPAASTIVEMDVNADAGTPNIIIGRNHAGTIVNIVSAALATAASGGIACSNTGGTTGINGATTCSATLQNTSLSAGDYLEAVSGTAGGTAKFFVAHIIYTVN